MRLLAPVSVRWLLPLIVLSGCVPAFLGLDGELHAAAEPVSDGSAVLQTQGYYVTDTLWVERVVPPGTWSPTWSYPSPPPEAYENRYRLFVQVVWFWADGLAASSLMVRADSAFAEPYERGSERWASEHENALAQLEAYYRTGRGARPKTPSLTWGTYQIRSDSLELRTLSHSPEAWPHVGSVGGWAGRIADAERFEQMRSTHDLRDVPSRARTWYRFRDSTLRPARDGNPTERYRPPRDRPPRDRRDQG